MVFYRRFYQRCKISIGALIAASLAGDRPVETPRREAGAIASAGPHRHRRRYTGRQTV